MASNKLQKETARRATVIANRRHTFSAISEATGIPEVSLRGFVSSGSLGRERLETLVAWLNQEGFTGEAETDGKKPTLLSGLAQELRGLATILEADGLDDAAKLGAFRDRILGYAKTFDKFGIGSK